MGEHNVIEAERLRKSYKESTALDGLSLQVPAGTVLGLLGPNGAGKTTTVAILSTALRPDGGHATVCGLDVATEARRIRPLIGFAGQFAAVDPNLTGRENLTLIGRLSRVPRRQAKSRAAELLADFGLLPAADRLVRAYSGGMRRRLDLAAALLHRPAVLFLDEPTTGLDPESRRALWASVRGLAAEGTTVLLTTQYLDEADALADEIVIIDSGRALDAGTPGELKARFGTVVFSLGFATAADAARAEQVLSLAGYEADREKADGERQIRVRSGAGSGEVAAVLRALAGRAPDPATVAVREPTLDDVFLSLTAGSRSLTAGGRS